MTDLRAAFFSDGSRLLAAPQAATPWALDKQRRQLACVPLRLFRGQRQWMIDYADSDAARPKRNHLHRFLSVSFGNGYEMHSGGDMIVEGWGWKRIHIGMKEADLKRVLGEPCARSTGIYLDYSAAWHLNVCIGETGHVNELHFNRGYPWRLNGSGYGLGSPKTSVLAWYGQPKAIVRVRDKAEMTSADAMLYVLGTSSRIYYHDHGLLFWFSADRVSQIVVGGARGVQYLVETPVTQGALTDRTFRGHRYRLVEKHVTWEEARDACIAVGGHLVIIETEDEARFVASLVPEDGRWDRFWLGASDAEVEGDWRWLDGTKVAYADWATNEPNDGGGIQDCGCIVAATKKWDDVQHNWGAPVGYICEWDGP